jgi:hypothetical protein
MFLAEYTPSGYDLSQIPTDGYPQAPLPLPGKVVTPESGPIEQILGNITQNVANTGDQVYDAAGNVVGVVADTLKPVLYVGVGLLALWTFIELNRAR